MEQQLNHFGSGKSLSSLLLVWLRWSTEGVKLHWHLSVLLGRFTVNNRREKKKKKRKTGNCLENLSSENIQMSRRCCYSSTVTFWVQVFECHCNLVADQVSSSSLSSLVTLPQRALTKCAPRAEGQMPSSIHTMNSDVYENFVHE